MNLFRYSDGCVCQHTYICTYVHFLKIFLLLCAFAADNYHYDFVLLLLFLFFVLAAVEVVVVYFSF